jgi:hypothetical protein
MDLERPMKMLTTNAKVQKGDVILSQSTGQPLFRVSSRLSARTPGYIIFTGEVLDKAWGMNNAPGGGQYAAGHRTNAVLVERTEARETDTGRYAPSEERNCRCGHSLGQHTAARSKGKQPCTVMMGRVACPCEVFKAER